MRRKTWAIVIGTAAVLTLGRTSLPAATMPAPAAMQKPSDSTLEDRIEYRLEVSPIVKKYNVKVKVQMGIAMLSGEVATKAQKDEAEKLAKIDGITRVENDIKVDAAADRTVADRVKKGLSKTGDAINDTWITTKVKWFFMGDDLLKGSDITVTTDKNVVTLKGTVKTSAGRARAKELAMQTEGVHRVVDQMTIVPE
jgi:osmotically-inducible protein OsmY